MSTRRRSPRTLGAGVLIALAAAPAAAQTEADRMPPVAEFLMEESLEIALARSAAPEHISGEAAVLVMRRDGYHTASRGENGFTCLVERSWSVPLRPERPSTDFWSPRILAPICYNAEASGTILGEYLRRTELALAGKTRAEMKRTIDADFAEGRLPTPRAVALSYMMSAGQMLGTDPSVGRYRPHVMFYVPYATAEQLGANPPGTPGPHIFEHEGGPYSSVVVIVPDVIEVSMPSAARGG